jgi:hypothetical protein
MKVLGPEEQQKIRRHATETLLVYDLATDSPIGRIIDMSARGMKLISEKQVIVNRMYYCRIPLTSSIDGCKEIMLDAECRWCNISPDTGWFESGYQLRFPVPKYADITQKIIYSWMAAQVNKLNSRHKFSMGRSRVSC